MAMRRNRRILSHKLYKWKARLNMHGGKQAHGADLWETNSRSSDLSDVNCKSIPYRWGVHHRLMYPRYILDARLHSALLLLKGVHQ
jgi:hypothetical protein